MPGPSATTRWALFLLLLGLYLTAFGYHSRDGDQAYRLPLLLHSQDPALYASDPFVRAFDAFNPHLGYLALLDAASSVLGLSGALFLLYALMFALACAGLDRLACSTWPHHGRIGVVAVGLVLLAKAGNIGTNHLFEPMLLDRGIAFALGWFALGEVVEMPERGRWTAPVFIGLAALVHPGVGLQLAILLGTAWIAYVLLGSVRTGVRTRVALQGLALLAIAVLPSAALNAGQSGRLFAGLGAEDFRAICLRIQSPQHLLPSLWRTSQWLAWACYFCLAGLTLLDREADEEPHSLWPRGRVRLVVLLGVNLLGLAAAWMAIEVFQDLRITVFQPFRLATVARGLALVAVARRFQRLWNAGDCFAKVRAALLAAGLMGDWSLIVVTAVEFAVAVGDAIARRNPRWLRRAGVLMGTAALGAGLVFLASHDTELGHRWLLAAMVGVMVWLVLQWLVRRRWPALLVDEKRWARRLSWGLIIVWVGPLLALSSPMVLSCDQGLGRTIVPALAQRWRFSEVPTDDLERLALWCRLNTPPSAIFIGPPGPKTFRLWSHRSLAFNRAGSPYHAEGLADWFARFRDHVSFEGSPQQFAQAYLADRQALEHRYAELSQEQLAQLATRQGATYIVTLAPRKNEISERPDDGQKLLHIEGRYAVYHLEDRESAVSLVSLQERAGAGARAGADRIVR